MMPDREKVMSWLEGLAEDESMMFHSFSEVGNIARYALALLKEQQERIETLATEDTESHGVFLCPPDGKFILRETLRYSVVN